ncbi:MAG: hypothetical protein ACRDPY_44165, partial [Streptosporangiaceae bacterium]
MWHRQRTDHDVVDQANTGLGHREPARPRGPDPARLAALAILQSSEGSHSPSDRKLASAKVTAPAPAAELIDRLRAAHVTLIYDPA